MKRIFFVTIALFVITGLSVYKPGYNKAGPTPAIVRASGNSAFIGTWKGREDCKAVSAPVAVVVITTDGPAQVFLTGVYSLKGKISGLVNGDTITVPHQVVKDPNFTNLEIEGTLTMSTTKKMLYGILKVINNNTIDNCTVTYRK